MCFICLKKKEKTSKPNQLGVISCLPLGSQPPLLGCRKGGGAKWLTVSKKSVQGLQLRQQQPAPHLLLISNTNTQAHANSIYFILKNLKGTRPGPLDWQCAGPSPWADIKSTMRLRHSQCVSVTSERWPLAGSPLLARKQEGTCTSRLEAEPCHHGELLVSLSA